MTRISLFLLLLALALAGCTCQRAENIAAKERLSEPPPPNPVEKLAEEVLDVRNLDKDRELLGRAGRMQFAEVRRRLGSLSFTSQGTFKMERSALGVNSKEDIEIKASDDGDFSIKLSTGDGGRQEVMYANGILFLKNNNGQWRASRDPTGEREELLEDSAGVWRTFYDLFSHTLELQPGEDTNYEGRPAVRYRFTLPDETRKVEEEVKEMPTIEARGILPLDAGVPSDEEEAKEKKEVMDRLRNWRKRTRPAGGEGTLIFDRESGVLLKTEFEGSLLVGDARNPARLDAKLHSKITDIGKPVAINVPANAVDEVSRKKWPIKPRRVLEKAGLVPPPAAPKKDEGKNEGQKESGK